MKWLITVAVMIGLGTSSVPYIINPIPTAQELFPALAGQSANLTVTKRVVGPAPEEDWQFNGSGEIGLFTLPAAGGAITHTVPEGTYTLTERQERAYAASASCSTGATADGGRIDVTVAADVDVQCTFTNTIQPATLIVTSTVLGKPPATDWQYTATSPIGSFAIDRNGGDRTFSSLPPATYTITSLPIAGYDVVATCSNQASGAGSVSVTLSAGEAVSCVFIYTGIPSISLNKTVGLESDSCATTDVIAVDPDTTVYYCYTVRNTSNVTFTHHQLDDSNLGTLLRQYRYDLGPGASFDTVTAGLVARDTITQTTINEATWTASFEGELTAFASASAAVNATLAITLQKSVGIVGDMPSCAATSVITVTAGTVVEYCYTVWNVGLLTLTSHSLVDNQFGPLFSDLSSELAPGESLSTLDLGTLVTATITTTTRNIATWTAVGPVVASSSLAGHAQSAPVTAVAAALVTVPAAQQPRVYLPIMMGQ